MCDGEIGSACLGVKIMVELAGGREIRCGDGAALGKAVASWERNWLDKYLREDGNVRELVRVRERERKLGRWCKGVLLFTRTPGKRPKGNRCCSFIRVTFSVNCCLNVLHSV